MLSTEELRRWCRSHTRRGQAQHLREYDREFSTMAFLRAIGMNWAFFYRWLDGKDRLPEPTARLMRRFVGDWEAGLLEFSTPGYARRRELVHRKTPRPVRARMVLDLESSVPRLKLLGRIERTRMPAFPDVAGALDGKQGKG